MSFYRVMKMFLSVYCDTSSTQVGTSKEGLRIAIDKEIYFEYHILISSVFVQLSNCSKLEIASIES